MGIILVFLASTLYPIQRSEHDEKALATLSQFIEVRVWWFGGSLTSISLGACVFITKVVTCLSSCIKEVKCLISR